MALIGVDAGGTGVKAVAYSHDGKQLKQSYREYSMKNPSPGIYVFDPREIYKAAEDVIKEVAFGCGEEVLGIGCSTFGESFVCLDENNKVMCDSIMYFDTRGGESVKDFSELWPQKELDKYGLWTPGHINSVIKMRVMSSENKDFFSRVRRIRMMPDFILSHFGAEHLCDDSIAATTRCHNIYTNEWIPEMLEWAGVDPSLMPKIIPMGAVMGEVPAGIAAEIGVKPGAKLVSGGHDHTAAAIGVGMYRAGQVMNEIGTVDVSQMLVGDNELKKLENTGLSGESTRFWKYAIPGIYFIMAGSGGLTGGATLKWFRDHFGLLEKAETIKKGISFYSEYDKLIPIDPTGLIVLPQFGTGKPARNQTGGILGMTMATTNAEIYKAFMECETFAVYTGLKHAIENIMKADDVIALGGAARSREYMQIRSDIYNLPVKTVISDQAGTHGDAILAGVAVGLWKNISEAIEKTVHIKDIFLPNQKNHDYYMEMYQKYMKLYEAVNDSMFPE